VLYSFLRKLSFPGSLTGDFYALMSASHIPRRLVQHKLVMLGLPADQAQKGLVTYSSSHDMSSTNLKKVLIQLSDQMVPEILTFLVLQIIFVLVFI
jgi:hypothetical protein